MPARWAGELFGFGVGEVDDDALCGVGELAEWEAGATFLEIGPVRTEVLSEVT